jgi:hypothetical protein
MGVFNTELVIAAVIIACRKAKSGKQLLPGLLLLLLVLVLQLLADACQLEAQQPAHCRRCYSPLQRKETGDGPVRFDKCIHGRLTTMVITR